MTTTSSRLNNDGSTRKTLSGQLDRLDGILDGLDSALTGAVQEVAYRQYCSAQLAERPDKAAVSHFHGRLMIEPRMTGWNRGELAKRRG